MSVAELYHGAFRATNSAGARQDVAALLSFVDSIPVDDAVARAFASLKAQLQAAGNSIPDFDLLIAATALVHGHILVTHNTRHFARIPGLTLDDWLV